MYVYFLIINPNLIFDWNIDSYAILFLSYSYVIPGRKSVSENRQLMQEASEHLNKKHKLLISPKW